MGVGLEYALTHGWSSRSEYLYMDLGDCGTSHVTCAIRSRLRGLRSQEHKHVVRRVGINYKFEFVKGVGKGKAVAAPVRVSK